MGRPWSSERNASTPRTTGFSGRSWGGAFEDTLNAVADRPILQSNPEALRVFVYAPFEEEIRRLRNMGKSEEEAYLLAKTVDQGRAAYIKQYFKFEWSLCVRSTIS
jgi:hypothetical protein